jgi:hypothetical protein
MVYGSFNRNFPPIRRRKHSCMLFTVKGNIMVSDWSAVTARLRNSAVKGCDNGLLLQYTTLNLESCEEYRKSQPL